VNQKECIGVAISHILKGFMIILGIWSIVKQDYIWAFASFLSFFVAMSPLVVKRNFKISLPLIMELLILIPLTMHVWGGVLNLYAIPYYDKAAHFIASIIIAFLALIIIYVLDVYWDGLKMDLFMVGFFIVIFTIALGGIWEIGEYTMDFIVIGEHKAQVSLNDTMMDLIYDSLAGIIVGIGGTIGIRKGEFRDIITSLGKQAEQLYNRPFIQSKQHVLETLREDIKRLEVDVKALPILEALNAREDYFTTSSCAGRIVLMQIPGIGKKRGAEFLHKWENRINVEAVHAAVKLGKKGELWLMAQPPIFHVAANDLPAAMTLVAVAKQSGFKDSSIKSIGHKIIVEISSTEELDVPLGRNGQLFCPDSYIELIVDIANEIIEMIDRKLAALYQAIDDSLLPKKADHR